MIFCFSATGNTKHVADEIKSAGEVIISIADALNSNELSFEIKDGRIGILTPTYNWGLPSIVHEFLEKAVFSYSEAPYVFYIGTCGTTTGSASSFVKSLLKSKDIKLNAEFDIKRPDTWIVLFDLSDERKVNKRLEKSEQEIEKLKKQLEHRALGKHMGLTTPLFIGRIGQRIYD